MKKLSVLGAGRMGSALVKAFLAADHSVTVWNRTAAKCAQLVEAGAVQAASPAEAIAAGEVVVSVLRDYDCARQVYEQAGVTGRGKVLVELSSGTPEQARRGHAWARGAGMDYLDGAMMATPDLIGQPGCVILYAGKKEVYDRLAATLRAIADQGVYVGNSVGHANVLDNSILITLWGVIHGMLQGAAICQAEQLSLTTYEDMLRGVFPLCEQMTLDCLRRIAERRYDADSLGSTLDICHASVRHILEVSRQHGLDEGLPRALDRVFERAAASGHARSDLAAAYVGLSLGPQSPGQGLIASE